MKHGVLMDARKFNSIVEAQEFCSDYYSEYVSDHLDKRYINQIMLIECRGLILPCDKEYIEAIRLNINKFPEVPYDIIVYRGGSMKEKNRPYLSGTFIESVGLSFAGGSHRKLHKIVVKKGAKIIPIFPINQLCNSGDPEMEVILDTSKFEKHFGYYCYQP